MPSGELAEARFFACAPLRLRMTYFRNTLSGMGPHLPRSAMGAQEFNHSRIGGQLQRRFAIIGTHINIRSTVEKQFNHLQVCVQYSEMQSCYVGVSACIYVCACIEKQSGQLTIVAEYGLM